MADIHPFIKPGGLSQKDEVDLLCQIVRSIQGICTKLDLDATVPLTTYLANCYTALFSVIITDSKGNRAGVTGSHIISPVGIGDAARVQLLYEIFNALETLTEQLVTDGLTLNTYESAGYTAIMLHKVIDSKGNSLGNGLSAYTFGPTAIGVENEYIDCLYEMVDALETITELLDVDGTVADADYEALWFTAIITTRIQNTQGYHLGANVSGSM